MNNTNVVEGWRAAATISGRSVASIRRMVSSGRLPAMKVDGKYQFAREELEILRSARSLHDGSMSMDGDGGTTPAGRLMDLEATLYKVGIKLDRLVRRLEQHLDRAESHALLFRN